MIQFLLNDEIVDIDSARTDQTVLEYLREQQGLSGTKEGCASGDCGACTVVLAEIDESKKSLQYRSINSCITYLSALHGKQLITSEHLADGNTLHPVQQAMVDEHGSQCGFCTPGFVMSMFAQYQKKQTINRAEVDHALSGNLCRCTGYRPIIDAALSSCNNYQEDKFAKKHSETLAALKKINKSQGGLDNLHLPTTREEMAGLIKTNPEAKLVAGSTDLALESTQLNIDIPVLIATSRMQDLLVLKEKKEGLLIGGAVTYQSMEPLLLKHFPELEELITRLGSLPIRNQATMGGNVANASPIGDTPPVLIALKAKINLDNGSERRTVEANKFFTGYRQTAMKKDEWIESILIPYKSKHGFLRAYKVSKRLEDDISAVCAVFYLETENQKISTVRAGFGGVAATPEGAMGLYKLLKDEDWSSIKTMKKGQKHLMGLFKPIDDVRATADYRLKMVGNLWHRFWLEFQATNADETHIIATRVIEHA